MKIEVFSAIICELAETFNGNALSGSLGPGLNMKANMKRTDGKFK